MIETAGAAVPHPREGRQTEIRLGKELECRRRVSERPALGYVDPVKGADSGYPTCHGGIPTVRMVVRLTANEMIPGLKQVAKSPA